MTTTIVLIWKEKCPKCEQVKELLKKFEDLDDVMIHQHESRTPEGNALIKEFNLVSAPTLLVFDSTKFVGKIEFGFTERALRENLERLMGRKLK